MARRQAAPKPEELIQKLEEKVDEFKGEVTAKLEEHTSINEEAKDALNVMREKHETDVTELRTSIEGSNEAFKSEIARESERCDNEVGKARVELMNQVEEKVDALKIEFTETVEKMAEQLAVMEKANSENISALRLNIEEKIENMENCLRQEISDITGQMNVESSNNEGTKDQIQTLFARIDDINEKMYEFETNKKNNLIFYGINGETRETPEKLMMKVE